MSTGSGVSQGIDTRRGGEYPLVPTLSVGSMSQSFERSSVALPHGRRSEPSTTHVYALESTTLRRQRSSSFSGGNSGGNGAIYATTESLSHYQSPRSLGKSLSDAQHEYDYPEVCVDTRKKGVRIVEREAVRGRQFPPAVADRAERLDEILRELEGMPEMLSASYVDGMEVKRSLYKDFSEVLARIGRLRDEYIVRKAPIEEVSDMVESVADQPQLSLSMASSLFDDTSVLKLIASRIRASIFFIGIGDAILTQQQSPLRCLSIMIRMYPYNAGAEPAGQDSARANDYRRYEQTVKSAFGYIRDTRDTLSTLCDKRLMNREGNGWREKQRLLQEHDKPIYPPKTAKSAIKELDGLGVAIKWILLTLNPEEFFPEPLTPTEHGDTSKKETADTSVLPPLVMVGGHPQPEQPTDKKKKKKGGGGIFPTRKKRSPSST